MKDLLQSGKITELKTSQNIAYILENAEIFNLTGYKVLANQNGEELIKCAKVLYNGKIKLLYFTAGHKSLKNMLALTDTDTFVIILSNLIKAVLDIKNNGFLSYQNLDLSFEKIYVDQHTFSVSLIYLPIKQNEIDEFDFENEFRTSLIKIITSTLSLSNPKMSKISALLSNGSLSFNDLNNAIKSEANGMGYKTDTVPKHNIDNDKKKNIGVQPTLEFVSLDNNNPVHLTINQPQFIIGKNPAKVNGVIGFNKAIGRVHCRFIYQNGRYYIVDGDGTKCSTNGTYVNGKRLTNIQPYAVNSGDRIRLANSDFAIRF